MLRNHLYRLSQHLVEPAHFARNAVVNRSLANFNNNSTKYFRVDLGRYLQLLALAVLGFLNC